MLERLLVVVAVALVVGAIWASVQGYKALVRRRLTSQAAASATGRPQLLFFATEHCAKCPQQKAAIQRLATRHGEQLSILSIDAQSRPDLARQYGVLTVPSTIVIGPEGAVRAINYGLTSAEQLEAQIGLRPPLTSAATV